MAQDPLHNVITLHHDKVLIVDFGSQVTQLIARRVREAGVYCEIATLLLVDLAFPRSRRRDQMALFH
jgi:GMP synthase (glutamine-hydrolysing)